MQTLNPVKKYSSFFTYLFPIKVVQKFPIAGKININEYQPEIEVNHGRTK